MESKNEFLNQKKQEPVKDIMMEDLNAVDPTVMANSTFTRHSFFHNAFSHSTFKLSAIKNATVQIQERAKNVKASRVIALIVILTIIGIFSIPVILYYVRKADPLPELNSAFTDVNISMVNSYVDMHVRIDETEAAKVFHTYIWMKSR